MKPLTLFLITIGVLLANVIICLCAMQLMAHEAKSDARAFLAITGLMDAVIVVLMVRLFKIDNLKHKL